MKLVLTATLAALLVSAAPALAADWPDSPDTLGGTWTMDGLTEGADSCVFQLGVEETIGGWTINLPPSCKKEFRVEAVTSWRINPDNGAIVFADAERHSVMEFTRLPDGSYVAHPGDGSDAQGIAIQKGDPADQHPPTPQEAMTGTWRISSLGVASLCSFDLTSDSKGKAGAVSVRPGCVSEWSTRGIVRWAIHGKSISLLDGRGNEVLEFKRVDMFTWEKTSSDDPYSRRGELMFFGKVF